MSLLSVGDIAPPFALPNETGSAFDLYGDDVAGNFIALLFCPDGILGAAEELRDFAEHYESLQQNAIKVVAISDEPQAELARHKEELSLPFALLSDCGRKLFSGYGIASNGNGSAARSVTLLLRPNQHCLGIIRDREQGRATLEMVTRQRERQSEVCLAFQPPILMVPDVLTADDCRYLIETYRTSDAPMVASSELNEMLEHGDVKTRVPDYGRQDRIDHFITSAEIQSFICQRLGTRLIPEIRKAFHYSVTQFEGLRIAHYSGERGGRAHGHRDNSKPEVANRRFALSINLNAESFDGGEIRFPEYGSQRYRAQTGAALVFSCSLLHEVLGVTHGERMVLLAFLYGDQ